MTAATATRTLCVAVAVLVSGSLSVAQPASKYARSLELYNRGVAALKRDDAPLANRLFREASEIDRENHAAWFQLGVLDEKAKRWNEAREHLEEAVRIVDQQPVYKAHLGRVLLELGSPREAVKVLGESLAIERGQYRVHYFLGRAREELAQFELAAKSWTEAARLEPCFTPSFTLLARLYARFGHWREAELVARQGVRCARPMATVAGLWEIMAQSHERRGKLSNAVSYYDNAIEAGAGPETLYRRGMLQRRLGLHDLARADLESYLGQPGISATNRRLATEALRELR